LVSDLALGLSGNGKNAGRENTNDPGTYAIEAWHFSKDERADE
jgi:hypothetical protein